MVFRLLRAPPLPQAVEEARRRHGWPPSPPRMFMVFDGIGKDENKCIFFFFVVFTSTPVGRVAYEQVYRRGSVCRDRTSHSRPVRRQSTSGFVQRVHVLFSATRRPRNYIFFRYRRPSYRFITKRSNRSNADNVVTKRG